MSTAKFSVLEKNIIRCHKFQRICFEAMCWIKLFLSLYPSCECSCSKWFMFFL